MAEALAVVSIVANIVQLVDFGSCVLKRLEEYQFKLGDIPEAFRHIKAELPVLLDALQETQSRIDAGSVREETKKALLPAIEGCRVQIRLLDDVISKVIPAASDSWIRRGGKAVRSLHYDAKVERLTVVIRGYIQTLMYHAAASLDQSADRTLPRPIPSSTVPFRRDQHFVDRQVLADIDCRSQQPASRLALVGLGGVGLDQPDADILMRVYSWLCDDTDGRWLMIVDNADDAEVFTSKSAGGRGSEDWFGSRAASTLLDSIPQSSNGSILITSRSRDVAFRLTGDYANIIKVRPMDQADALALLRNQLKGDSGQDYAEPDGMGQEDATALVEALDCMPLAISQAAAYIGQRAPRATVSRYLQGLRQGDRDRAKLLQMDLGDTRRDGTASNSVIATWQISFEHIRRERPSATRLLSLMSLFNRQGIPESLLGRRYHESSDVSADFEDDLNTLLSFSLVATDVDGRHFQMHRLVQFSTIKWLELRGDLEGWKEKYVTLMDENYPDSKYENWKACQALFSHAQAAVPCRPTRESPLEAWTSVLSKAMVYAHEMGYYQVAQEMGRLALEARENTLGAEHPCTLSSVGRLATALRVGGKYEEAQVMFRRAMQGREKVLGPEDPLTLSDLSNLGLVSSERGNYKEAELIYRRSLQSNEKVLGLENTSTLASVDNLGLALGKQGKLHEAEAMHRRALEGSKKRLGDRHPDTLVCARNLASVLGFLARYEEAESLHRRVLDDSVRVLGEEHPFTSYSFCNLGSVLHSQGKHQEAAAMHRQALARREKILGREHPHTLSSMHNLAKPLKTLGCNQEAISLMKACCKLRKQILGPLHPDTKKSFKALNEWVF
ncbi:MAG: hypothetical protein Q9165_007297 [Trypethelium subeluteriae]